jgi:phosphoglycolate phosphatase/dihydroneopterin aldolase
VTNERSAEAENPGACHHVIHIEQLELSTHIGVPDDERANAQRLTANVTFEPLFGLDGAGDEIANTVDYFQVARALQTLASSRPRKLIETLAAEIAELLLAQFDIRMVEVELRKYILPDTAWVAVRFRQER